MDSERSADEVFRLLSDEIRLDILRAVAVGQDENRGRGVAELSFSDIYDRVPVDNTSKLSYHLGELTGTFLRKHEDGYAFTHAGEQLVRFVLSGNFRSPPDFGTVETDANCLFCGEAAVQATVQEQYFILRCDACGKPAFSYRIRPALARSHPNSKLVEVVGRENVADVLKTRQGVCPDCSGRMETEILDRDHELYPPDAPGSFATLSECGECLRILSLPLPYAVAYHPASVAFHWERGVDVLNSGGWEFHDRLVDGRWTAERTDVDDADFRVELTQDDDSLVCYLDENAEVVRTERLTRSGGPTDSS